MMSISLPVLAVLFSGRDFQDSVVIIDGKSTSGLGASPGLWRSSRLRRRERSSLPLPPLRAMARHPPAAGKNSGYGRSYLADDKAADGAAQPGTGSLAVRFGRLFPSLSKLGPMSPLNPGPHRKPLRPMQRIGLRAFASVSEAVGSADTTHRALGLGAHFALLHETRLCGTRKRLAILTHCFGGAGIRHAFLHERCFCRTRERLAVFTDRFALASFLCKSSTTSKRRNERG
jgi:hypothetical protein